MADFKDEGQVNVATGQNKVHALQKPREVKCRYCGRTHEALRNACPASNSECGKCGMVGHWAAACRNPNPDNQRHQGQKRHQGQNRYQGQNRQAKGSYNRGQRNRVAEVSTSREQDEGQLFFDALHTAKSRSEAFADLKVRIEGMPGSHTFHAKVDTGADGNILPARCLEKMPATVQLKEEKAGSQPTMALK